MAWDSLRTGLRAQLWIRCPSCGIEGDFIEFDASEMARSVEAQADCEDCGHRMTAYLDALVQHEVSKDEAV